MATDSPTIIDKPAASAAQAVVRRQIRGSSLLLAGRFLAKGTNFLTQVLIVRYLSQTDYGALAYALAIVTLTQGIATFGLDRAITRFLPIYHERQEYGKLFGTILMVAGVILSIGLAITIVFCGLHGLIAGRLIHNQHAITLLLVLIFLAPVQAFDELLVHLFAVFANPKAIFFRRHVLGPAIKMIVVLLVMLGGGSVQTLAAGMLAGGLVGVAVCMIMLWQVFRREGLFQHWRWHEVTMPWRPILAFTIPLLTTELVYVVMHTMDVVVLERYGTLEDVASLRAVQPMALLTQLVMASFATLYTPAAARLFARDDRRGINDLYWQMAIWIAILSFPTLLLTFSLAKPVTVLVLGSRYENSGILLALLGLGHYVNAATGFNGLTLKVYGKLRYVVVINLLAAALNLAAILLLIPRYGALGAAIGTCASMMVHNILKQGGLRLGTGIRLFDMRYLRVYLTIALPALGLWLLQSALSPPPVLSFALAALVSLWVLRCNRHVLNAGHVFPELLRLPLMRQLLGP